MFEHLHKMSGPTRLAAILFVAGKLTSVPAAVTVFTANPTASTWLTLYALLIASAVVVSAVEWYRARDRVEYVKVGEDEEGEAIFKVARRSMRGV